MSPETAPPQRSAILTRCFYISEIAPGVTDLDVQIILGVAQLNNRRLDVTGMLAQSDGHFAQLLEGRTEVVVGLLERIRLDPRHRDVRVLLTEHVSRRQFASWAMGLVRRDDKTAEMRQLHREGCADATQARRLIMTLLAWTP